MKLSVIKCFNGMLQTLDSICETSFCLQKSVDLQDWQTAGHISCIDDNIVQVGKVKPGIELIFFFKANTRQNKTACQRRIKADNIM